MVVIFRVFFATLPKGRVVIQKSSPTNGSLYHGDGKISKVLSLSSLKDHQQSKSKQNQSLIIPKESHWNPSTNPQIFHDPHHPHLDLDKGGITLSIDRTQFDLFTMKQNPPVFIGKMLGKPLQMGGAFRINPMKENLT